MFRPLAFTASVGGNFENSATIHFAFSRKIAMLDEKLDGTRMMLIPASFGTVCTSGTHVTGDAGERVVGASVAAHAHGQLTTIHARNLKFYDGRH